MVGFFFVSEEIYRENSEIDMGELSKRYLFTVLIMSMKIGRKVVERNDCFSVLHNIVDTHIHIYTHTYRYHERKETLRELFQVSAPIVRIAIFEERINECSVT